DTFKKNSFCSLLFKYFFFIFSSKPLKIKKMEENEILAQELQQNDKDDPMEITQLPSQNELGKSQELPKDPKEEWVQQKIKLLTEARSLLQLSFQPDSLPGRETVNFFFHFSLKNKVQTKTKK